MSPRPPEDPFGRLVAEIQAGRDVERNSQALYHLTHAPVHRRFARWGFRPDECEDFTQETFLRVFKSIGSFHFGSCFATWLHQVVENVYKNELRRRQAEKRPQASQERSIDELRADGSGADARTLGALASPLPNAEEETLHREQVAELRTALTRLPPQMRQCLLLRLDQGLRYREIATAMHISIETVKAHLHQAKARLLRELRDASALAGLDDEGPDDA